MQDRRRTAGNLDILLSSGLLGFEVPTYELSRDKGASLDTGIDIMLLSLGHDNGLMWIDAVGVWERAVAGTVGAGDANRTIAESISILDQTLD